MKRSISILSLLIVASPSIALEEPERGNGRFALLPALPQPLPKISFPQEERSWHAAPIQIEKPSIDSEQIQKEWAQGIYAWLCYQQNPLTGLVESFDRSQDPFLEDQGATYDQALAGMAFLLMGDRERAKRILDFYQSRWEGKGFYNFYSTVNGRVGLEWRRHVGPNMWLALLIYQYTAMTQDETYLPLAEGLCDWVLSLPHYNGGVAMSDLEEPEIPWPEIVSTENVIDVVAVFQMAVKMTRDYRKKTWYEQELTQSKQFFKNVVIGADGAIGRGYRPFLDGVDRVAALDTVTWLIATSLPQNIFSEYGVAVSTLIQKAEETFGIDLEPGRGYDYTSLTEARKANRERICSLEWSAEMAQVYWLTLDCADLLAEPKEKREQRLSQILKGLDAYMIREEGRISYPYASHAAEKTFADGWLTPDVKRRGGQAGSVAATCWRFFATTWNPLRLDQKQKLPSFDLKKSPLPHPTSKEIEAAKNLPSALTSEGLTTAAWLNLKQGDQNEAKKYALKCIHLYSKEALQQQALKGGNGGLILSKVTNDKIKQRIFRYSQLNDVAACWVILSKINPELKKEATQMIHSKYSLAQIWDPRGFFWTAIDALSKK